MSSEIEIYWEYGSGPTQVQLYPRVAGTYGYRQLVDPTNFGTAQMNRFTDPVPFGPGTVERGYVFDKPRSVVLALHIQAGTERKAFSELEDLEAAFRADREGNLRLKYTENDGPTVRDRYLTCRRTDFQSWGSPSATMFKGAHSGGVLRVIYQLEAVYPHWRTYTAETDTASLSTVSQNIIITNDGHYPIGVKVGLSALVGSWTSVAITNNTAGPQGASIQGSGTVTWSHTTGFSNGDELDWRHTYPHLVTQTDGNTGATDELTLWPGSNDIDVVGVGGTSGTVTFTWKEAWT